MGITEQITGMVSDVKNTINELSPAAKAGIAAAGVATAVGVTALAVSKSRKKRTKSKPKSRKSSHKRKTRRSKRRITKYARTAGKLKDRSHKIIRMTKSGQPYIILASGKARFISKKSARISRKRRGGRY